MLSTASVIMVQVLCPEPCKKKEAKEAIKPDEKPAAPPPMSKLAKTVVAIVLIAGSLDTFGDFGNRFARNTILSNRYPLARQSVVQYVLMASNVLSIFIAQKILTRTMAKLGPMAGMGWWCILGNVASAIVQFALLVIVRYDPHLEAMGAFVVVWLLSQIFGFCSTLASMFLYPAFVPPHRKGTLLGVRNSLTSLVNCVAPVMLALIYQTGSLTTGADRLAALDQASIVCLGVCGGISTLAILGFAPLRRILPKPPPKKAAAAAAAAAADAPAAESKTGAVAVVPEKVKRPLTDYDQVSWLDWTALTVKERASIQEERLKAGLSRVHLPWGTWSADHVIADQIMAKAHDELGQFRRLQTEWVTSSDEKLAEIMKWREMVVANRNEDGEAKAKRERAREAMGRWFADYLDDAGYEMWDVVPHMYKVFIMNAFPPLDALDEKVAAYKDVAEFRTAILAGMRVQDLHIKMAETTSFTDLRYPEAIGKAL